MAASLKAPQKKKIDYNISKDVYDTFVKTCSKKGFTPNVIIERLMVKYNETGQA